MTNPNPSRITNPVWSLWTNRPGANWRLGGILAWKCSYHAPLEWVVKNCTNHYSNRFFLDTAYRNTASAKYARGIDWTMSDVEMLVYTTRLIKAADANDPRMKPVRDFYGTTNGSTVNGRIRDDDKSPFKFGSSDLSHLWHIHMSIWTAYIFDQKAMDGIISVLKGESLETWLGKGNKMSIINLKQTDKNYEANRFLQRRLNKLGANLKVDGDWGTKTQEAVAASRSSFKYGNPDVSFITGWHAEDMDDALAMLRAKEAMNLVTPVNKQEILDEIFNFIHANKADFRGEPGKDGRTPIEFETSIVVNATRFEE